MHKFGKNVYRGKRYAQIW